MEYRITTTETILRQYVVTAATQAAAAELFAQSSAPARHLHDEDGPITAHPERIEHIEEEQPAPGLDCPRCRRVMAMAQGGGFECRYHGCRNE